MADELATAWNVGPNRARRSWVSALELAALLSLGACGGSSSIQPSGTAGQPSGTAGSGSGAAGATGSAGSAGMTGDAGVSDVVGATGSAGAAGTGGGDAAAGTTTDGGGDANEAETNTSDGPSAPKVINADNWNETTIYPFAKRRMLLRDEGNPHVHLIDLGNPANDWSTVAEGPWARSMQLIGNNQVLGGTSSGYQVFDFTDGHIVKTVTGFGNTQSAYRMANGETMLTQSGTVLTFLDSNDQKAHQITYPGHGYVRLARPTRNGTFLVPSDVTLFEGDAAGNVLWQVTPAGLGWGHIFEALLMGDGNVLVSTFFGASCDVVDQTTHMVTKRYGTRQMPNAAMFEPNAFSEFEILPNGNIITSNWEGYGGTVGTFGIQVIEFDPTGAVAWYYQQDPAVFSSIQGVMVLDGKDPRYLHVQETSSDSTWQPVIPTP